MLISKLHSGMPGKRTIAIALLFASTLAWFYIFNSYFLREIFRATGLNSSLYYVGIILLAIFTVGSGIAGSLISEKFERRKFLAIWMAFGLFTTISIAFFHGLEFFLILSAMVGVSFGLGFPACQAFLTESVNIEKRGLAAGITIGFSFVLVVFAILFASVLEIGVLELVAVLALLKATGFIAIVIDPCKRETGPIISWPSIIKSREFYSYAVAWLVFQLANGVTIMGNLSQVFPSVQDTAAVLEFLATIFAAFIGGFFADRFGRKQPMIVGLIMLGLSYAFLGLMYQETIVYLIYVTVEGFALGIIAVVYLQVILGDISSRSGSKERFYALGGVLIPFLIAAVFGATQKWSGLVLPVNWLTAILSIVILLSVIPVLRAPETLPQEIIRERKLKKHVEEVGKLVKESRKEE